MYIILFYYSYFCSVHKMYNTWKQIEKRIQKQFTTLRGIFKNIYYSKQENITLYNE